MTVITVRMPEQKHARLKSLATSKNISMNKLIEEATTTLLAEHDAYTRFKLRASRGNIKRGMELLDKALEK